MSRFLAAMAEGSRRRAEEARGRRPLEWLRAEATSMQPARGLGGFGATFDVIAEIKPRSPAVGLLPPRQPLAQAEAYESGGAAMLSVLTEPTAFGGSLALLEEVAGRATVPVLRKDFLVDPYQVYQARVAGADGVLLIGRMLDDASLEEMLAAVTDAGMFALLEAFDGEDLERLARIPNPGHLLLGVNCRDLDSLEVRPERHVELAERLRLDAVVLAESGVGDAAEAAALARLGYRGVLVGSALMESETPSTLVASILTEARRVGATAR